MFVIFPISILTQYKFFYITTSFAVFSISILALYRTINVTWLLKKSIGVFVLFAMFYLSCLWSINPDGTVIRCLEISIFLLVFVNSLVWMRYVSYKKVRDLFVFLPFVIAAINVILLTIYGDIRPVNSAMHEEIGSYSNHSAAIMTAILPYIVYMLKFTPKKKILVGLSLVLNVSAILISQSRAAYLVMIISLILMGVLYNKGVKHTSIALGRYLLLLMGIMFITYCTTPDLLMESINRIASTKLYLTGELVRGETVDYERLLMYREGLNAIRENPFWGIGFGSLKEYMEEKHGYGKISHNILITIWAGSGILAVLIFFRLVYKVLQNLFTAYKTEKRSNPEKSYYYLASAISMVAMLIHGMFRSQLALPFFYFPLAMGVMLDKKAFLMIPAPKVQELNSVSGTSNAI
jgi:O-antigen ligase